MNGNATGSARLSLDAFDAVFGSGAAPRTTAAVRSACCTTSMRSAWVQPALTMSMGTLSGHRNQCPLWLSYDALAPVRVRLRRTGPSYYR